MIAKEGVQEQTETTTKQPFVHHLCHTPLPLLVVSPRSHTNLGNNRHHRPSPPSANPKSDHPSRCITLESVILRYKDPGTYTSSNTPPNQTFSRNDGPQSPDKRKQESKGQRELSKEIHSHERGKQNNVHQQRKKISLRGRVSGTDDLDGDIKLVIKPHRRPNNPIRH